MNLNLAAPVATAELTAILGSVGANTMLSGTVYTPIMQTLVAPIQQGENSVGIWELTQKVYAAKNGGVTLDADEVKILKTKIETIAYPWLKARLKDLLDPKPAAVAQEGT